MPLPSAPTLLNLLRRCLHFASLFGPWHRLRQSCWAVVINALVVTLSSFKTVIRAVVVLRSNCCINIWQEVLVGIVAARWLAFWGLYLAAWDHFSVLGFCYFQDPVAVLDRAVARVFSWWDFDIAGMAVHTSWFIQFWEKIITLHFWFYPDIISLLNILIWATCLTQKLIYHLSSLMGLPLPWFLIDLWISLATYWWLFVKIQYLLIGHRLLSLLIHVLPGLLWLFICRQSPDSPSSWISLWVLQAFAEWRGLRNFRADVAATLRLKTGSVFVLQNLEVVLWIDFLVCLR